MIFRALTGLISGETMWRNKLENTSAKAVDFAIKRQSYIAL